MSVLGPLYLLIGALLCVAAWRTASDVAHPRRMSATLFWAVLAIAVAAGEWIAPRVLGAMVIVLALIAGFGGVTRRVVADSEQARRSAGAQRLGHRLFWPALAIPLLTVLLILLGHRIAASWKLALDTQQLTLWSLALSCVVAMLIACVLTRQSPRPAGEAGADLIDAVGWAIVLPLMLAVLGSVFAAAGVGDAVAHLVAGLIATDSRIACVVAYGVGMALFTVIMGNAFAAFPVMTAGVGLPLLVGVHHADPASMAALGMLSGYCGTLLTPMAANFNIVPAALLKLDDPNAVIRAQAPTGLILLAVNLVLMWVIIFR